MNPLRPRFPDPVLPPTAASPGGTDGPHGQVVPAPQHNMGPACTCQHPATAAAYPTQVPTRESPGISPATALALGGAGALTLGTVLVALLLSVALVAISAAITAISITVCALVMRSLVSGPGR